MNPYTVLGVHRNAKKATITKAYRRKCKKAHPDVGGSLEEFQQVKLAYDILSDEKRRQKYDATGTVDATTPDNELPRTLDMVATVFDATLKAIIAAGKAPESVDFLQLMRDALAKQKESIRQQRKALKDFKKRYQKLLGRFTTNDDNNFLEHLVCVCLKNIDAALAKLDADVVVLENAEKFFAKFRFAKDAQQAIMQRPFLVLRPVTAATAGGSW